MKSLITCLLLPAGLLLSACDQSTAMEPDEAPPLHLATWPSGSGLAAATVEFLPSQDDLRLAAGQGGLTVLDAAGKSLASVAGKYGLLDTRAQKGGFTIATQDMGRQQVAVLALEAADWRFGQPVFLPPRDFPVEGLCLYRDEGDNLTLFLVGDEGRGEQWLVTGPMAAPIEPRLIRSLSLPPQATACRADDASGRLYVNEENLGLWVQDARSEAAAGRDAVDLRQPHGGLASGVSALAVVPGGVLAVDPGSATLRRYDGRGAALAPAGIAALTDPDGITARVTEKGTQILLRDDATGQFYEGLLDWRPASPPTAPALAVVLPQGQTEPVGRRGDAADDPAIWLNPSDPARSRVLGTNKKQGLLVYDLDGKLVQELPVGRLNNVDVRAGFQLGGTVVDIAVASNRDRNTIDVFAIDRTTGILRSAGAVATDLAEIYGICLFQAADGALHAFANGKDGRFQQYGLEAGQDSVTGSLLREFKVASQPEGCVADDRHQRLFFGEEDAGVWAVDARADQPAVPVSVATVGDLLVADVEGMAIHPGDGDGDGYLVVSSQGNDSYVVFDALPPYRPRGAFRIGLNALAGIDGASETDGLEVTATPLGGPWGKGLLVVQDGHKRMPEDSQNFKLVPWSGVAEALGLD